MRHRVLVVIAWLVLIGCAARMPVPPEGSAASGPAPQVGQTTSSVAPVSTAQPAAAQHGSELKLPLEPKSVRFAVIGDSGTGSAEQYEVAQEMERYRQKVGFDFVIMLGDNIYGGKSQPDFDRKFELPYKPLLDAGVKFYASLGNHDSPNERLYKPFNMSGARYYSFKKRNATFLVLDSNYMDPSQLSWLEKQLQSSDSAWKICYFHHPLYSDGRFHGPDTNLRALLTPLFEKYGVNVVLSGHDHVYERIRPKNGTHYFVLGNSGELRYHNLRPSQDMLAGFDSDRDFMLVEITVDTLYFQTISRTGQTVDSGVLQRPAHPANTGKTEPLPGNPH